MDLRLLAKVAQWLVLNPKIRESRKKRGLGERTMKQHDGLVQTLSSEIKFNLVYIPFLLFTNCMNLLGLNFSRPWLPHILKEG